MLARAAVCGPACLVPAVCPGPSALFLSLAVLTSCLSESAATAVAFEVFSFSNVKRWAAFQGTPQLFHLICPIGPIIIFFFKNVHNKHRGIWCSVAVKQGSTFRWAVFPVRFVLV